MSEPMQDSNHASLIVETDEVVAKLPKESLKALLYMVAGKPDSNLKLFRDPVCLTPSDIIELNDLIREKLRNHDVEVAITTININYAKDEIEQYGIWEEFVQHRWTTHKETESLTAKWDFLVKIPEYPIPQRHTIVLKVSSRLTPFHFMQAMFSGDPDEMEKLETEAAPVVCRIDFINHVLSDELMRIVENWHKARIKPLYNLAYEEFLEDHKNTIARIVHLSIPLFITGVAAGILNRYLGTTYQPDTSITVAIMKVFMFWLLGSVVVITFFNQAVGHWLASKIYESIANYGQHAVFNFTNGDKNKQQKIEQDNRKSLTTFFWSILGAIAINLLSSVVAYFLFQ